MDPSVAISAHHDIPVTPMVTGLARNCRRGSTPPVNRFFSRRTPSKSPYAVEMSIPAGEQAVAIAVPIRSFAGGKERLSPTLSTEERGTLARRMSDNLLNALASFHVVVVTNDAEVERWARSCNVDVLRPETPGLDNAAEAARMWARDLNKTQLVVVHSDVPQPRSLPTICGLPGITIVPDHQRDGTNVLALPIDIEFRFSYGKNSFRRHLKEANSIALERKIPLRLIHHHELGLDVDTPLDLTHPLADTATKELTR